MIYQQERDECIDRLAREGLRLDVTQTLLRCATTLQRLAELACSSEAADRDRVPCPEVPCLCDFDGAHQDIPRIRLQDWRCERRATYAVPADWTVLTQGDPRGAVLRVIPPSYAERNAGKDRFNVEGIYIPARPSRLRF